MKYKTTLFDTLSRNYHRFFKNDSFNARLAHESLSGLDHRTIRCRYIKNIYSMFLFSDLISADSKYYISTGASYEDIAIEKCNSHNLDKTQQNIQKYKNKMLYENHKYTEMVLINYEGKARNIADIIINEADIDDNTWKEIDEKLVNILSNQNISYINKKFIIHFPKVSFNGELSEKRFNEFINILKPYSLKAKNEVEKDMKNYQNEIAYMAYILNEDADLNKQDHNRLDKINELFDVSYIKEFIEAKKVKEQTEEADNTDFQINYNSQKELLEDEYNTLINKCGQIIINSLNELYTNKDNTKHSIKESVTEINNLVKQSSFININELSEVINGKKDIESFIEVKEQLNEKKKPESSNESAEESKNETKNVSISTQESKRVQFG